MASPTNENTTDSESAIDSIVHSLIGSCLNEQEVVSEPVCNLVYSYSRKHPNNILKSCLFYLQEEITPTSQISDIKLIKLIKIIKKLCQNSLDKIIEGNCELILTYCITYLYEIDENLQNEIESDLCDIISYIASKHTHKVMETLLTKFNNEPMSYVYIVKCFGIISNSNSYNVVPYLKELLSFIITLLPSIKKDLHKKIFAKTFTCFVECIEEYFSNVGETEDNSIDQTSFNREFDNIFDTVYSWLNTKDTSVKEQVIKCLGFICSQLSHSKFDSISLELLNNFLSFYRKGANFFQTNRDFQLYYATEGLYHFLQCVVSRNNNSFLRFQIENVLYALFSQVCALPHKSEQSYIRNRNEILRCFNIVSERHIDLVISFVLSRLDDNSEVSKVRALIILKHLINACNEGIILNMASIFYSLKRILNEESIKVRKMLMEVIVTIAHHGYLDLEGGQSLIQFIIRQCAINESSIKGKNLEEKIPDQSLKEMSESVVDLLVTTVEEIDKIMWPHLFKYLISPKYIEALPVLCKSLASIGEKMRPDKRIFHQNSYQQSGIPKPEQLMARFCILLGNAFEFTERISILRLMKIIAVNIDRNLDIFWSKNCDRLINCLSEEKISNDKWKSLCLDFINESLINIDNIELKTEFGKSLLSQIYLYQNHPFARNFLLMTLGNLIKQLNSKTFASEALEFSFNYINHTLESDREGFAYAVGKSSANHLDMIIVKLEKLAEQRKTTTFLVSLFDSVRSGTNLEQENAKATLILCYGYITKYAASQLLITRLETPILRTIHTYYIKSKDNLVKTCFIQAIIIIAQSLLPENLKELYVLKRKADLIDEMLTIMKSQNFNDDQHQLAIEALLNLIKLDPPLSEEEKKIIIEVVSNEVYTRIHSKGLLNAMKDLFEQFLILEKGGTQTLELIALHIMKPWLLSDSVPHRESSMDIIYHILQVFYNNINDWDFKEFNPLGALVGLILPRCFDSLFNVQRQAYSCFKSICLIANKLQNLPLNDNVTNLMDSLIHYSNENSFNHLMNDKDLMILTNYLAQKMKLSKTERLLMIKSLIDGLTEKINSCSEGCFKILDYLFNLLINDLKFDIAVIIDYLLVKMPYISCETTKSNLDSIIIHICYHHINIVINHLLTVPIDYINTISRFWKVIATNETLCSSTIEILLEILKEEKLVTMHPIYKKIANHRPLASVYAFREMFDIEIKLSKNCEKYFFHLLVSLLLAASNYIEAKYIPGELANSIYRNKDFEYTIPESPAKITLETIKKLFICLDRHKVASLISDKIWKVMEIQDLFSEGLYNLASITCKEHPEGIARLVEALNNCLNDSEQSKLITIIFFSQILLISSYENELCEPLVANLLSMLSDHSLVIRKECIKCLGMIGHLCFHLNSNLSDSILSALISGLEDNQESRDILYESLNGLCNLVELMNKNHVKTFGIHLAMRLRALFDVEKSSITLLAIKTYGKLVRIAQDILKDILFSNLIPLIVYFPIENQYSEVCQVALQESIKIFGNDSLLKILNKPFSHFNYCEFITIFVTMIEEEMNERWESVISIILSYLNSDALEIQCNAILILGLIFSKLKCDKLNFKFKVIQILIQLLKESRSNQVKVKAAEALTLIYF